MSFRTEINKIETRKIIKKLNKTTNIFLKKINKSGKSLGRLRKKRRLKIKI